MCRFGSGADLSGIYTLDDMKAYGVSKGWCPYFFTRQMLSYANVIVFNYQVLWRPFLCSLGLCINASTPLSTHAPVLLSDQYMLDPKVSGLVSRELDARSIVVFDEAHNIDNICVEALSVSIDRRALDLSTRNLRKLEISVKRSVDTSSWHRNLVLRNLAALVQLVLPSPAE